MSHRPGAPQSTTDEYLKAILAELRELNARLSQDAPKGIEVQLGVEGKFGSDVAEQFNEMCRDGRIRFV